MRDFILLSPFLFIYRPKNSTTLLRLVTKVC